MTDQLDAIKARFQQVGVALTNPEIIANQKEVSYVLAKFGEKSSDECDEVIE